VDEGDGEQSVHVDLARSAASEAGVDRGVLEPADDVLDRGRVRRLDLLGNLAIGERPQRRDTLDRRETQIESGDRNLSRWLRPVGVMRLW
jgi:hypothetical protein